MVKNHKHLITFAILVVSKAAKLAKNLMFCLNSRFVRLKMVKIHEIGHFGGFQGCAFGLNSGFVKAQNGQNLPFWWLQGKTRHNPCVLA